ncbi:hypothetical protein FRC00_011395 [Tulasnella sp. 408]|nr:hypothetical protein FRC00_011395 [Tulasnella sp. 408]
MLFFRLARSRSLGLPKSPAIRTYASAAPVARWAAGRLAVGGAVLGTASYALGSVYPPTVVELAFPRPAPPSPSSDSPEGQDQVQQIEHTLHHLPLVEAYRTNTKEYYETRPYASYPEEKRIHSLTAGTLSGPGKFAVRPLVFAKWDESESVVFIHLGRSLCGHDGIVHGGLLATILDEALARTAFMNLPSKIGVTANLNINYKLPTKADQFIVVKTRIAEVKGRKATVTGLIEDLNGKVLVEVTGLFVEPKYANMLKMDTIGKIMGERPKAGHPIIGVDVAVTS